MVQHKLQQLQNQLLQMRARCEEREQTVKLKRQRLEKMETKYDYLVKVIADAVDEFAGVKPTATAGEPNFEPTCNSHTHNMHQGSSTS